MAKTTIKNSDGTVENVSTKSMLWAFFVTIAILSAAVGYIASNFTPTFWNFFALTFLAAWVIRVSVKYAVLSVKVLFIDHDWEREDFLNTDPNPSWLARMRNYLESVSAPVDAAFKPVDEAPDPAPATDNDNSADGDAPDPDPAPTTDDGTEDEDDDEESDDPDPAHDPDPAPDPAPDPTVGSDATDDGSEQSEESEYGPLG